MSSFVQRQQSNRDTPASQRPAAPQAATEAPPVLPVPAPASPSHADIAQRAYGIYQSAGCRKGDCGQNWQQAERELGKPPVAAGYPETQPIGRAAFATAAQSFDDVMPSMKSGNTSSLSGGTPVSRASENS